MGVLNGNYYNQASALKAVIFLKFYMSLFITVELLNNIVIVFLDQIYIYQKIFMFYFMKQLSYLKISLSRLRHFSI